VQPPGQISGHGPMGSLTEQSNGDALSGARQRASDLRSGLVFMSVGVAALLVWIGWRSQSVDMHPVELVFFGAEFVGLVCAVTISLGLARAGEQRTVYVDEPHDSHWFAVAVADIVGRTRTVDLHREFRSVARAAPRWRPRNLPDATISVVLLEGPRRLAMVLAVSLGLLIGVSPFAAPPWWAAGAAALGYTSLAASHVALGRGRLRAGDRLRWSYGAIGEIVARTDLAGHAPRRWIGAMAVAVGVSMVVALRGVSDRWTHGLTAMDYDERVPGLVVAGLLVLGALYTIATTPRPDPADPSVVVRRLEESSVRQALLVAAVLTGLLGMLAGVMPATDEDVDRVVVSPPGAVPMQEVDGG